MVSLLPIPKSLWIWKGANELQGSNVLMTATCYLLSIHDKNNDDSNFTCLNIQLRESPDFCQQFTTRTETTEIFNSAGSVPASLRFAFGRRTCDLRGSMYPKGTTEAATLRGANMTPLQFHILSLTPKLKRQHPCCLIWRGRGPPFLGGWNRNSRNLASITTLQK